MKLSTSIKNLTCAEWILWSVSVAVITLCSLVFGKTDMLNLVASLIGVSALIFVSKGDVLGQILTVVFSIFYGIISFKFHYYGEMITYVGMTAPMAVMSIVSWLKNPFDKNKNEVKVAPLTLKNAVLGIALSAVVTLLFYFILKYFNTANLIFSTISVTTSFLACWLTFCRSSFYALAYALNDIVLIILWTFATIEDFSYFAMVLCFLMFLVNDLYGFYNWRKMSKRQNSKNSIQKD